jgi:hypothetical protein
MSKEEVSEFILDDVVKLLKQKRINKTEPNPKHH